MRAAHPTRTAAMVGAVAAAMASGNLWVTLLTGVLIGLVVKDDSHPGRGQLSS